MNKIRKVIIKCLLGNDWEEYWELHKKYTQELKCNLDLIDENMKLRNRLIKEMKEHLETLERRITITEEHLELLKLCKDNGIVNETGEFIGKEN